MGSSARSYWTEESGGWCKKRRASKQAGFYATMLQSKQSVSACRGGGKQAAIMRQIIRHIRYLRGSDDPCPCPAFR